MRRSGVTTKQIGNLQYGAEDMINVAISHIFSNDYYINQNANSPVEVLQSKPSTKCSKHRTYAAQLTGSRVVPIIMAATIGWLPESYHYPSALGRYFANRTNCLENWAQTILFHRHAARLSAGNARFLLSGAVEELSLDDMFW